MAGLGDMFGASFAAVNGQKPRNSDRIQAGQPLNLRGAFEAATNIPVVGDALSGGMAMYDAAKGDYPSAAMNALGVLPFVSGTFIGKGAKTWDAIKAADAEKRIAAGDDARKVWKETGTFKGPDGHLRQEIDDSQSRFVPTKWNKQFSDNPEIESASIGSAFKHDGMSAAYPFANDVDLILNPNIKANASFHEANPDIGLGDYVQWKVDRRGDINRSEDFLNRMKDPASPDFWKTQVRESLEGPYKIGTPRETIRETKQYMQEKGALLDEMKQGRLNETPSTLLHELQHAIQGREGWARGGSADSFAKQSQEAHDMISAHNRNMARIVKEMDAAKESFNAPAVERLKAEYERSMGLRDELVSQAQQDPYDAYKRLAGEAEARATQARMNMNMDQRLNIYPLDSYDVPVDQLIVRGNTPIGAAFGGK